MTRWIVLVAAAFVVFSTPVGPVSAQQPSSRARLRIPPEIERGMEETLAAYAGGDDLAVDRWMSSTAVVDEQIRNRRRDQDINRTNLARLASFEAFLARSSGPWSRARAAFVLELVSVALRSNAPGGSSLLRMGWSLMVGRPTALGADPTEDRFEVLWHQAALGLAQGMQQYWLQQDHLDLIGLRFKDARHLIVDTRVPLARAVAAAGLCCWKEVPGEPVQSVLPSQRRPVSTEQAVALLEEAVTIPALRVEALVRGAVLLHKVGRHADARAWFDRIPAHDDGGLAYVQHLTHGRVLDGLNRPADAAAAYRTALSFEPASQPASIGLAAALLRSGRAEEASIAAASARRMSDETAQPGVVFRRGDLRFVPEWLAEIRRLRR